MEVFKQFVMDQWSGNIRETVAALNLARSTDIKPMQSTCLWFVFLSIVTPTQIRSLTSMSVWELGAKHDKTVFDTAAGEFVDWASGADSRWYHRVDRNVSTCYARKSLW